MTGEDPTKCPKSGEIKRISDKLDEAMTLIKTVKAEVESNTRSRIYEEGFRAGLTKGKDGVVEKENSFLKYIDVALTVISRIIAAGIVIGVLLVAGGSVGLLDFIMNLLGWKN